MEHLRKIVPVGSVLDLGTRSIRTEFELNKYNTVLLEVQKFFNRDYVVTESDLRRNFIFTISSDKILDKFNIFGFGQNTFDKESKVVVQNFQKAVNKGLEKVRTVIDPDLVNRFQTDIKLSRITVLDNYTFHHVIPYKDLTQLVEAYDMGMNHCLTYLETGLDYSTIGQQPTSDTIQAVLKGLVPLLNSLNMSIKALDESYLAVGGPNKTVSGTWTQLGYRPTLPMTIWTGFYVIAQNLLNKNGSTLIRMDKTLGTLRTNLSEIYDKDDPKLDKSQCMMVYNTVMSIMDILLQISYGHVVPCLYNLMIQIFDAQDQGLLIKK